MEEGKYSSYKEQREGRIFGSSHHESGSYVNQEEPTTAVNAFDEMGFFLPFKNLPEIPSTYSAYTEYNQPDPGETTTQYQVTEYYPPQKEERQETYMKYEKQNRESRTENRMFSNNMHRMSNEMNGDGESKETSMEEKMSKEIEKIDKKVNEIDEELKKSDAMISEDKLTGDMGDDRSGGVVKGVLATIAKDDSSYSSCPIKPADTRRMFDMPGEPEETKIADMGRRGSRCPRTPVNCKNDKYRSYNGVCNNLKSPYLGTKDSPYTRMLPAAYGDIFLPRGVTKYTKDNGYESSLPSPRKITDSIMIQGNENETESRMNTHMVMQWGQFVDHDIIKTSKDAFDCCDPLIKNSPRCFPIPVPETDSFYAEFGKTCLDFTRSDTHCDGNKDNTEQFNRMTSFIDGSAVYGCHEERALMLRGGEARQGGKLLENSQLPHFLPSKFDLKLRMGALSKATDFVAGDERVETQASLTSIHNLFFNEHNRIASKLFEALKDRVADEKELDELVYQESRRIVSGEMQSITYNEFLPRVLGKAGMSKHQLDHKPEDCVYDETADPSIINSFAAAAYRFGHSLVQSVFRGHNQPWRLGKFYSDARFAFKDNGHGYVNELMGLSEQPCQQADLHMSNQLSHMLFCNNKTVPGGGHDLVSTNIQRGRDHGIPSYNSFRRKCGLASIESMQSRPAEIPEEEWTAIGSVYEEVDQIDLYVGGLAETSVPGAAIGPTFSCIIGTQFKALMDGDRFFYKHTGGPGIKPLEGSMLEQVERRRLSDIICENTDVEELTQNVFIQPSGENPKIACDKHGKLDLDAIVEQLKTDI